MSQQSQAAALTCAAQIGVRVHPRWLGLGARAFVEGLEDAMVQAIGCFGIQVGAVQGCC
jgi:hypothetical protein